MRVKSMKVFQPKRQWPALFAPKPICPKTRVLLFLEDFEPEPVFHNKDV